MIWVIQSSSCLHCRGHYGLLLVQHRTFPCADDNGAFLQAVLCIPALFQASVSATPAQMLRFMQRSAVAVKTKPRRLMQPQLAKTQLKGAKRRLKKAAATARVWRPAYRLRVAHLVRFDSLSQCAACGHSFSLSEIETHWSRDPTSVTAQCPSCGAAAPARIRVWHGDDGAQGEAVAYYCPGQLLRALRGMPVGQRCKRVLAAQSPDVFWIIIAYVQKGSSGTAISRIFPEGDNRRDWAACLRLLPRTVQSWGQAPKTKGRSGANRGAGAASKGRSAAATANAGVATGSAAAATGRAAAVTDGAVTA